MPSKVLATNPLWSWTKLEVSTQNHMLCNRSKEF
jgi:hypothetical protein